MKKSMILIILCFLLVFSIFNVCAAESEEITKDDLQGVWGIESMDVGRGENRRTRVPQYFYLFITENYYSSIRDFSEEFREEILDGSFMADSGTYDFDGFEMTVYQKASMIPNMVDGGSMAFKIEMEGNDTLILRPQYDKMNVPGMDIAPTEEGKMGYGDLAVLYRFKRLE